MFYRTGDFKMTICAKFAGREASSCTRGDACICHDFIEGCDCDNCKAHELKLLKKSRVDEGWLYELPFNGNYRTYFVCGDRPTDPRFLNKRKCFSVCE
jgi:hypothetical protein